MVHIILNYSQYVGDTLVHFAFIDIVVIMAK